MIATKGPRRTKAVLPLTEEQRRMAEEYRERAEYVAKCLKMTAASMDEEERIGFGMIGLLDAVTTYDESKGMSLESWIDLRVRNAILDACRDGKTSTIRVPRLAVSRLDPEEAYNLRRPLSIDEPHGDRGGPRGGWYTVLDLIPAPGDYEPPADMESIWFAVRCQGGTTAAVLDLYYNRHLTMRQIGDRLCMSESRVSQIHSAALAELRTNPRVREAVVA